MIKAVLFDLDDTLLRLNLSAFILRYVAGASRLLADAARTSPAALALPFARSFLAIDAQDRSDSLTSPPSPTGSRSITMGYEWIGGFESTS